MKLSTLLMFLAGLAISIGLIYFGYRWFVKKNIRRNVIERTLAIVKPDAVRAHHTGKIIDKIEQENFTVIDLRKVQLDREQAEKFYEMHKDKKFFHQLVDYMTGGPVVVMILEKMNAIIDWRDLMGATDPAKAKEGSIRKLFGTDIGKNAVHGSDSPEAAHREIRFFFADRIKE